jgi:DDB1- and CUL4-associated factor 11
MLYTDSWQSVTMTEGQWTITDASLSNDNKWLAYSSLTNIACLARSDPLDDSYPQSLNFSRVAGQRHQRYFSIYSVRFGTDGREIIAGTGGRTSPEKCIYVFDIERNESILRIQGHDDDVNAVCFGDTNSPHILYSGSDDGTVKVWDRRSISEGRPSGVFLGHTAGLTYVDSKGDGRYVLSNSKDQTTKLWDLRKVLGPEELRNYDSSVAMSSGFSYFGGRRGHHHLQSRDKDCSVVTFRGHRIEQTLVRCHFSPKGSTDGRYVYSGSADGQIYVWNMDATLKQKINVKDSCRFLKERSQQTDYYYHTDPGTFSTNIRDCSWHPDVPMIAGKSVIAVDRLLLTMLATAWNGWGGYQGTLSIHSWRETGEEEDWNTAILDPELDPVVQRRRARLRGPRW